MATVHIFGVTLMSPPLLLLSPLFSSSFLFLQSLSPPSPITVATVDVHVNLHDPPPQQPLARDCRFHRPPPRVQGHEGCYQVDVVGGQAIRMSSVEGGGAATVDAVAILCPPRHRHNRYPQCHHCPCRCNPRHCRPCRCQAAVSWLSRNQATSRRRSRCHSLAEDWEDCWDEEEEQRPRWWWRRADG